MPSVSVSPRFAARRRSEPDGAVWRPVRVTHRTYPVLLATTVPTSVPTVAALPAVVPTVAAPAARFRSHGVLLARLRVRARIPRARRRTSMAARPRAKSPKRRPPHSGGPALRRRYGRKRQDGSRPRRETPSWISSNRCELNHQVKSAILAGCAARPSTVAPLAARAA